MPATIIIGSQWGDEGKGKITDLLSADTDLVVRFQGGNNAGHTVIVADKTYKFHLIPSGVIFGKPCLIASGVVLDPAVLLKEIAVLRENALEPKLVIDPHTNIIMPWHQELDAAKEAVLGERKIGTTKKGIGPCYADRVNRTGIRFIDLLEEDLFREKVARNYADSKLLLESVYQQSPRYSEQEIFDQYHEMGASLRSYYGDVGGLVAKALKESKHVIFEGAQGTFLDISYGTYPFVTSSHTISGGVFSNVGIPPMSMDTIGIVKAYTTRVGSGPFPTELTDKLGDKIREIGKEFGTTTGRPRRVGWLDLVMLKYAHRLNGFTQLALTKLDVLSGLDSIKVAVGYRLADKPLQFPLSLKQLEQCEAVYEEFEGFEIDSSLREWDQLPEAAKKYINFISKTLQVPVSMVSVGPARKETIMASSGEQ